MRAAVLLALAGVAGAQHTNVVLIVADDLGYTDLACYGHATHETPHLDGLAAQGLRCTHAYANAPNCAPSRAALMSGQLASRTGIYTVKSSARGKSANRRLIPIENQTVLADEQVTLAEAFQAAGYTTAVMGKWHLGDDPCTQGFDVNVGGSQWGHPKGYFSPFNNPDLEDGPEGEYLTDRLGAEAARFIGEHADGPFFLYLPFYAVHTPIQPREDLKAHYEGVEGVPHVGYAAMVTATDQAVGRVLAALDEHEVADETVVVFFSDNGGHGRVTSMAPLRGAKGMLYEGGVREPLIVRWPGRITPGTESDVPQIGTDLYPTLCAAAGVPLPEGKLLDGENLVPLWTRGEAPEREALYWHFPAYLEGGGKGRWRLTPSGSVRAGHWKLIERFETGALELYDVVGDVGEENECSAEHPEVTARLHGMLKAWRERTGAPVPTELNPEYEGE